MNKIIRYIKTPSITKQLIVAIALVHAILMTIFVVDLVYKQRTFLKNQNKINSVELSKTIATGSVSWVLARDVVGLQEIILSQSQHKYLQYAMILAPNGEILAHTEEQHIGKYLKDSISRSLLNIAPDLQILINNNNLIDVATPIYTENTFIGWVRVGLSQNSIRQNIIDISKNGIWYILLAIISGIVYAIFMSRSITSGLRHLVHVANEITNGNENLRISLSRKDELGKLGDNLNIMIDSIIQQKNIIKEAKNKLTLEKEKAEENEKYTKMLFDLSPVGLALTDTSGNMVNVNASYADIIGYSIEETILLSYWDITPKKYNREEEIQLQNLINNGTYGPYIKEYQHKSGKLIPVRLMGKFIERDGKTYIWSSVEDISNIKKAESELKESEERFRSIFSQSTDGVLIIDSNNKYIDCNNAAFQKLLLNSKDEIIGKSPWDISPENQPDGTKSKDKGKSILEDCLKTKQNQFEWVHQKNDGKPLWLDIVLTQITINKEKFIHCVWRDITKLKNYQLELEKHQNKLEDMVNERTAELKATMNNLQETQSQLIQSEKMASLGVMTAGIAHEINNPLNYIMGSYTGLEKCLKEHKQKDERLTILLDSLKTGIDRTSDIIKGLNQFSRSKDTMDEKCNIHSIIDNCLIMLNIQIKNKIEVVKQYGKGIYEVPGNVGMLHQVFINILANSIQAIKTTGTVTIATKKATNKLIIEICDTGCGINKKDISKILDPFFTTKDPGKGTGLGLSITYSIIKEHNGKLEYISEINKGTKAKVELPLI